MAKKTFPRFSNANKVQAIAIDQVRRLPQYAFSTQAEAICDYWKLSADTQRQLRISLRANHAQILWEMQ